MAENDIDWESIPFELTETDIQNIRLGDEHFVPHDWEELKNIIATNNLSILKRKPSDLKRYILWTNKTKAKYGSMTNFVCKERLHWTPLPSSIAASDPVFECKNERPFASPADYKILRNDWPYGLATGITHLVVWLKTRISVQQPEGFLLPESTELIQGFVQKTFIDRLAKEGIDTEDRVQWFKNWVGLQSVRGLDHFHVLVRDVPETMVEEWTQNGSP
ncbi:MAG: hypothetical protein Q9164_002833 [Protoblastenia rupestris]